MSKGIFITATGTDVGKTFVTALILKKMREYGLNAGYYKAALSGAEPIGDKLVPGDAKYVCDIAGIAEEPAKLVSYIYQNAVSPHLAAKLEGNSLDIDVVSADFRVATQKFDYICVEGSGGIVCPLRIDQEQIILLTDIIAQLNLSIVIVASAMLGTINSTVLTVEYAREKGISIKGIILNHYDEADIIHRDNKEKIELLTGIPVIACVKTNDTSLDIDVQQLCNLFEEV